MSECNSRCLLPDARGTRGGHMGEGLKIASLLKVHVKALRWPAFY